MDIQFGLDIATSISIIGAAISFFISQRQSRNKKRDFYIYEKLSKIVVILADYKYEINKLSIEMTWAKRNYDEVENNDQKEYYQKEYKILGLKLKNKCFALHKIFSTNVDIFKDIANENEKKSLVSTVKYIVELCKDDATLIKKASSGELISVLDHGIREINKEINLRLE